MIGKTFDSKVSCSVIYFLALNFYANLFVKLKGKHFKIMKIAKLSNRIVQTESIDGKIFL